jgi:hypothetical protein
MDMVLVITEVLIKGRTSVLDAAMLLNAVLDKSGGLVQSELIGSKFAKC